MSEASRTKNNLHTAYVEEAKASIRLRAFAEQAQKEGFTQMAHLFRTIAAAEEVHALSHFRKLGAVGSTEENMEQAFSSESDVASKAYQEFIAVAEEENERAALISFSHARDAEASHASLYKAAMGAMLEDAETEFHLCTVCGYVTSSAPPDKCPVCQAPKERFRQVD
jgi:rubrerythrin